MAQNARAHQMKQTSVVATLVVATIGVYLSGAPTFAFHQQDVKPIAALELMEEDELVFEAAVPCIYIAVYYTMVKQYESVATDPERTRQYRRARNYLSTIALVARKLNNGHMPQWANEMQEAASNAEGQRCVEIGSQVSEVTVQKKLDTILEDTKEQGAAEEADGVRED
jgi:hypothetical protein